MLIIVGFEGSGYITPASFASLSAWASCFHLPMQPLQQNPTVLLALTVVKPGVTGLPEIGQFLFTGSAEASVVPFTQQGFLQFGGHLLFSRQQGFMHLNAHLPALWHGHEPSRLTITNLELHPVPASMDAAVIARMQAEVNPNDQNDLFLMIPSPSISGGPDRVTTSDRKLPQPKSSARLVPYFPSFTIV